MICFGEVPAGAVLPIQFTTYGKTNGESITLTGLAVTDIEVYKGTSMTQRASDAGYTLLDTDGIDIDGVTGFHGFSIDTGDNTDAGFYAVGSYYTVLVSAVTIDSQTVNFIAATFRIKAAEAITGKVKADVDGWLGTACATPTVAGVPEVDVTHLGGDAQSGTDLKDFADAGYNPVTNYISGIDGTLNQLDDLNNAVTAPTAAANADAVWDEAQADHVAAGSFGEVATETAAILVDTGTTLDGRIPAALVSGRMDASVGAVAANTITAAAIADGAIDNATFAADVGSTAIATNVIGIAAKKGVVDALNVDTYAEPAQGTPAATTTLVAKIGYLFKNWRNKKTQTATQWSLLNDDAVTVDHKATVADDGTTASKGEIATGP